MVCDGLSITFLLLSIVSCRKMYFHHLSLRNLRKWKEGNKVIDKSLVQLFVKVREILCSVD